MTSQFVNAHTHMYSGLVPLGMPAPEPRPENFLQVLERVWWRLDRAIDADILRASVRFYVTEAKIHSTVGLVDHHESPNFIEGSLDVIANECQQLGMPAVVCYGATERNFGREEAQRGLAECRRFIADNSREVVRGVIGLHASFTVSDDTIREAANMARELGTVLHIHVAEDLADVEDAKKRGYAGVIDRLEKLDAMVPGSIFAHGVHLEQAEVEACAAAGCWIVQNPRSNRANQVGYPRFHASSTKVALGTDGFSANMPEENKALHKVGLKHEKAEDLGVRLPAGRDLFVELFGDESVFTRPADVLNDELSRDALHEVRSHAEQMAARLWQRMEQY